MSVCLSSNCNKCDRINEVVLGDWIKYECSLNKGSTIKIVNKSDLDERRVVACEVEAYGHL